MQSLSPHRPSKTCRAARRAPVARPPAHVRACVQVLPTMRSVEALDAGFMPGFSASASLARTGWHSKAEAAVNEQIR